MNVNNQRQSFDVQSDRSDRQLLAFDDFSNLKMNYSSNSSNNNENSDVNLNNLVNSSQKKKSNFNLNIFGEDYIEHDSIVISEDINLESCEDFRHF